MILESDAITSTSVSGLSWNAHRGTGWGGRRPGWRAADLLAEVLDGLADFAAASAGLFLNRARDFVTGPFVTQVLVVAQVAD
jgi:hypothetical protein